MANVKEFDFHDLVKDVTQKLPVTDGTHSAEDVLAQCFKSLIDATVVYNRVEIHGFGVFTLRHTAAKSGVDPNGNPWEKPEGKTIKFKPWKTVRDNLNKA